MSNVAQLSDEDATILYSYGFIPYFVISLAIFLFSPIPMSHFPL